MNPFYRAISERAKHRCEYCQAPEVVFNFPFDVEQTGDPILPVDCVFEGETEFPKSYYDTDKEQD